MNKVDAIKVLAEDNEEMISGKARELLETIS